MQNEEQIVRILEKMASNLENLFDRVDVLTKKMDNITDIVDKVNNGIEVMLEYAGYTDDINFIQDIERGVSEVYITIEETQFSTVNNDKKIHELDEEIKELRNDISNIQQITAMNLNDIGKLKAKR